MGVLVGEWVGLGCDGEDEIRDKGWGLKLESESGLG